MSEIVNVPMSAQRDIKTVTVEIHQLHRQGQEMALRYSVEIGRRLKEAKEMLEHGEWGQWVKNELPFSQSTAGNFMRIYEEYGADQASFFGELKSQALANLSYTKALRLLTIEDESEREAFVESHDVGEMSSRELEKAIAERNELRTHVAEMEIRVSEAKMEVDAAKTELNDAREQFDEAKEEALAKEEDLRKQLVKAETDVEKAKARAAAAEDKLKKLETDRKTLSPDELEKIREQARAAANGEIKEAEKRAEELRRQLAAADPNTAVFRERFDAVQRAFEALEQCYMRILTADTEKAGKLKTAATAVLDKLRTQVAEEW
ncbi:MAG: DUF3102 domain-containing protein [Oscillospiraceae bacterium]|nr:DUF3102 domain-containing protein [Oscillospiraceae bacterium]